jgi:glycosyltransferase involved in cell wall biosynthesis
MGDKFYNPDISIIVPIYKAEQYLTECLNSILTQTFYNFELILVDDGSPDKSLAICNEFAIKDRRIIVIHKKNGGASTARKVGVHIARGKYIGWVDADDKVAPDMFSTLYNLIEYYNADIVECQYLMQIGNTTVRSGKEEPIVVGQDDFILHQFFNAQMKPNLVNKLYKSELLKNIEFPPRQIHVDCYINMRLSLMPLKYVRTPEVKYNYILRKGSNITTYTTREIREAIYLYDYSMFLATDVASTDMAKKYLRRDAINRMIGRYFEVSINANLRSQHVYNYLIKKKLGFSLVVYLMSADIPLKTRISFVLILSNLKSLQVFLHNHFGRK